MGASSSCKLNLGYLRSDTAVEGDISYLLLCGGKAKKGKCAPRQLKSAQGVITLSASCGKALPHTTWAVGRPAKGAWAEIGGSPNLAEVATNPWPILTDIVPTPLAQLGRGPLANLGRPQPTSIKVGRGAIKM
ncbi:hypothetical protein C8R44DRAFT_738922 [Mycena epipterygia]|nr:hypothetical protein C8R44DRAFT_738922 [Mycena epipterygia]